MRIYIYIYLCVDLYVCIVFVCCIFYFDYFLSVACYEVFIQRCLRFTLCFPITDYFFKVRHLQTSFLASRCI